MKGRRSSEERRLEAKAQMLAELDNNVHPMTTDRKEPFMADEGPHSEWRPAPGPCMDRSAGGVEVCELRAGHAGGHESGSMRWTRSPETEPDVTGVRIAPPPGTASLWFVLDDTVWRVDVEGILTAGQPGPHMSIRQHAVLVALLRLALDENS